MKKILVWAKQYRSLLEILLAALLAFGLLMTIKPAPSGYVIYVLAFIALLMLVKKGLRYYNKRRGWFAAFFAVPFGLAFWLGQKVIYQSVELRPMQVFDLVSIATIVFVAWLTFLVIVGLIDEYAMKVGRNKVTLFKNRGWLKASVIIFLCWLPLFLVYFPGIVSVDSAVQLRQAIGEGGWSNWHPVVHTAFVAIPVNLGMNMFGDLTAGIALSTLVQMGVLATIFGYVVKWMTTKTSRKWLGVCALLVFGLFPVIACYSVTMWKDVLFAACFLLLIINVCDLVMRYRRSEKLGTKDLVKMGCIAVCVGFLRNGGVLIIAMLGIAMLIWYKKMRKQLAVGVIVLVAGVAIVQGPLYGAMGIQASPFVESMSVPVQQLAYVLHTSDLTDDERDKLSKYADVECLRLNYAPMNADPAKNCFNYDAVNEDKMGLINVWLDVMKGHLGGYVKAYILHTYGYWYVQADNWILDFGHTHDDIWLSEDYTDKSLLGEGVKSKVTQFENGFVASPYLGWLNNTGCLFWGMVFMLIVFLYQKKYYMLVPMSCVLIYMISLLVASPVSWIFRYVYCLLLILPIFVLMSLIRKEKK